jgi:hypothetical protein
MRRLPAIIQRLHIVQLFSDLPNLYDFSVGHSPKGPP